MGRVWLGRMTCCWLLAVAAQAAEARAAESPRATAVAPPEEDVAPPEEEQTEKPPLVLEDLIAPLEQLNPATDEQRSQVEALSLFAAGRMKEQQEDYSSALRLYQRALRHDPDSLTILRDIVRVAFQLERNAEAVRYALKAAQLAPSDPLWLRQLGVVMKEEGDLAGAIELYEQALKLEQDKQSASFVMLTMELGKLYFLAGQPAKAAESFSQVMPALDNPGDYGLDEKTLQKTLLEEAAPTYLLIGKAFLAVEQPDAALAAFEKAQAAAPDAAVHAYHLAQVEALRGAPAKALEQLDEYLGARTASQGAAPYELLARLLAESNKPDALIGRLEELRKLDGRNAPLRAFLAGQYLAVEKLDQAEPLFVEAVEQAPSPEAFQGLSAIYRRTNRPGPLLKVLGESVAKTGGLEMLSEEAQTIAADEALLTSLLETARRQHAEDPDSLGPGARLAAALLALEAKRLDDADEFFSLALKVQRENAAELLLTWGLGLLTHERYADAARVFQRGIDERFLPADNPTFHFYLSGALAMDGKIDEALQAARAAAGLVQDSPRLESRVPWILYYAKRYEEAAQAYRDLIARFDSKHQSEEVRETLRQARLVLSHIAVTRNDIPQAEEWLEQVLDEFPDDVSAQNDLGYLWADQGKHLERAFEMIQGAVAAEPDNAAYRDSLGWVLYRMGRHEEAVVELERAAAGDEPDSVILDHLGDAYLAAGRVDAARQAWERALAAFEKNSEADKAAAVRKKLDAHPAQAKE